MIVDRLADLAERLAAAGPLVLVCDDLQWADRSSVRLRLGPLAAQDARRLAAERLGAPVTAATRRRHTRR